MRVQRFGFERTPAADYACFRLGIRVQALCLSLCLSFSPSLSLSLSLSGFGLGVTSQAFLFRFSCLVFKLWVYG